jgi:hypothetical protein
MSAQAPAFTIFSLPNELLVAIAAAGQEGRVADLQTTFRSEWTLSHLSRRFREVIVGAPALWTLVEADLDHEGSLEILKLYLERSRACNIWAALRHHTVVVISEHNIAEKFSRIIPHIDRIWRLSIRLRTASEEVLAPFRDITAPILQHLEIINENIYYELQPIELFSSGTPKLTFMKMAGLTAFPLARWTAPLTHLELGRIEEWETPDFLVAITTQCPLLIHLRIDMSWVFQTVHIPSLKFLHISVLDNEDEQYLLSVVNFFDTPAVTELIIDGTHGDQIFVFFDSTRPHHSSFPALTSLYFVDRNPCFCESDLLPIVGTTSSSPQQFPALSSLSLINQCFTPNLVKGILGPASEPWPLLKTVTLCPKKSAVENVYRTLQDAARSKQRRQALPKLRLSPALLSLGNWQESGVEVEKFDPVDFLSAFRVP